MHSAAPPAHCPRRRLRHTSRRRLSCGVDLRRWPSGSPHARLILAAPRSRPETLLEARRSLACERAPLVTHGNCSAPENRCAAYQLAARASANEQETPETRSARQKPPDWPDSARRTRPTLRLVNFALGRRAKAARGGPTKRARSACKQCTPGLFGPSNWLETRSGLVPARR